MNTKQAASINLNRKKRTSYPAWMTAEQAAHFLDVSVGHVYELVRRGEIPAFNAGRSVRIDRDGLFLAAREKARKRMEKATG